MQASTPPFPALMPNASAHGHAHDDGHGHSHDDDHHGHSHAHGNCNDHGHSHAAGHGHSHDAHDHDDHHSHGHDAHGHAHDSHDHEHGHSHSHGAGDDHDHGHSHAGGHDDHGHAHSHGGGDDHGHSHAHANSITGSGNGASGVSDFGPRRTDRRSWAVWWAEQSKLIHADRDAKRLFYFIALNACYMGVQLFYGLVVFNIDLITGSFHTGFDCLALASSLAAMVVSRRQPEFSFSYGYDRFEVLAGFTNALFLLFVAVFLIFESAHMFYKPFETRGDGALAIALMGVCVDAVGFALFHKQSRVLSGGGSVGAGSGAAMRLDLSSFGADRGGRESNLAGVFLHILADVLHHIAHVTAVGLAIWRGWTLAHGALSLLIAVLIIRTVYPLFQYTGLILLQTTPHSTQALIESRCRQQIGYHEGVLEVKDAHFWTHSPGVTVGSIHIRVRANVQEAAVLQYAHAQLKPYVQHLTVQIVKDNWMIG